jgi:hypothetical protein
VPTNAAVPDPIPGSSFIATEWLDGEDLSARLVRCCADAVHEGALGADLPHAHLEPGAAAGADPSGERRAHRARRRRVRHRAHARARAPQRPDPRPPALRHGLGRPGPPAAGPLSRTPSVQIPDRQPSAMDAVVPNPRPPALRHGGGRPGPRPPALRHGGGRPGPRPPALRHGRPSLLPSTVALAPAENSTPHPAAW